MIELYGNEIWNSNTPNQYKKVIIASESRFESITDALENAGLNYCGYIIKNKSYIAVGRATVPNLEKCRNRPSDYEHNKKHHHFHEQIKGKHTKLCNG